MRVRRAGLFQRRDRARGAGQLEDVQARVRAVGSVDVAAIVDFRVVGLHRRLADLLAVDRAAAFGGERRQAGMYDATSVK